MPSNIFASIGSTSVMHFLTPGPPERKEDSLDQTHFFGCPACSKPYVANGQHCNPDVCISFEIKPVFFSAAVERWCFLLTMYRKTIGFVDHHNLFILVDDSLFQDLGQHVRMDPL